ncbi:MAG: Uma2 family endonuclease [Armatimonadetes bacterium]|nr:Uma2 family endonuclease [Armatimonadota bacterium]
MSSGNPAFSLTLAPPAPHPPPAPLGLSSALLARLGEPPLARILTSPAPGEGSEADVLALLRRRPCELVAGVLIEKPMGLYESALASHLGRRIGNFAEERNLGMVTGEAGTVRLAPGLVRIPDVSFFAWDRLPGRAFPAEPISSLAPNLAVEVLSESNTAAEMAVKVRDYFGAGVEAVWILDPEARTVDVYTGPDTVRRCGEQDVLEGEPAVPGFRLRVGEWLDAVPRSSRPATI